MASVSSLPLVLPSALFLLFFTLVTLPLIIAEVASDASGDTGDRSDATDLFAWARLHGARIAERIEIKETVHGGRGLFAKSDIPANTELIQIPYRLQLGVRQLAEGTDEELQLMARRLPWGYIKRNELFFLPLSVALVAEKRKGDKSMFSTFFRSLPKYCPNALGLASTSAGVYGNDDLRDLSHWAPRSADKIQQRRAGIKYLHEALSPSSVSIQEIQWAASHVCSRSLIRKRVQELTPDQVHQIGDFPASDHSRMLPVIDLVNHGSLERANVWVGHQSRDKGSDDDNDFSTSLKSTRDIAAGEELLFDYGGGSEKIRNDRLLLDYGFVLPGHTYQVSISLDEFNTAISGLDEYRVGMKDVPKKDLEDLNKIIRVLTKQASEEHIGAPLVFSANGGEPTVPTLAVAVAMTCRSPGDVTHLLNLARQSLLERDASALPSQLIEKCPELQKEFARFALKVAAGFALEQRPPVTANDRDDNQGDCDAPGIKRKDGFAKVAREYSSLCRAALHEVADMSR